MIFDEHRRLTTEEKALKINLNQSIYGSFSEIGAGQEVAANFFRAGGSSGTIAYTMSAYDMKISDSIYGKAKRYVCEERLVTMLNKEYSQITHELSHRADDTKFFAFANTVEALNYHKTNQGQGWIGLKFQLTPNSEPNECILHIKMHDPNNRLQHDALGILGVNLIHSCFYNADNPEQLLLNIFDRLSRERVEIDMFRLTGPDFENVDNRLMSLKLVKFGFTDATVFHPSGKILQPSEALYKKNILLLRGRFRPPTLVNINMLETGLNQFKKEDDVDEDNISVLFELTLKDLKQDGEINDQDFLDRVNLLGSVGHTVMISNYQKFYKVVSYLSGFTKGKKIGVILGIYSLQTIFEEKYYTNLSGGIFEAFGVGFGNNVKMLVYPAHIHGTKDLYTLENFAVPTKIQGLYSHMIENNRLEDIKGVNTSLLDIFSDNVLKMIKEGEMSDWENMVPKNITHEIKQNCLFNYPCTIES